MFNHSFSEQIFHNIQCEPPLVQFEAISPCFISSSLGGRGNPHLTTISLQVPVESNKCKFQERKGEEVLSSAEISEPWDCLNRFVEQLHLHAICTFLFQKSAYTDCSCYALPKYLGVIQGNGLDCCRWVVDPWEVLEVSGSSLITAHYSREGKDVLSTVSFGALTGHLPKHLLAWARWAVMGVLCLILLLGSVGAKLLFCGAFQCFLQWFPCDFRPLWLGQFVSTKTIFIISVKSLDVLECCTCYIHIFKHLVMP